MKIKDRFVIKISSVFAFCFFLCCLVVYGSFVNNKSGIGEVIFLYKVLGSLYLSALVLLVLIGNFFLQRLLTPVTEITAQVQSINTSKTDPSITAGKEDDEFYLLASSINAMMARLDESSRLQKQFVANVTHELKTPLAGIMGDLEDTFRKEYSLPEYQLLLDSFYKRLQAFNQLSNHLLQLMEVSFDATRIKLNPLRLDELIWESVAEVKKRIPGRDISVDIVVADHTIPDSLCMIEGNKGLLLIAFVNLLENALKYSSAPNPVEIILYLNKAGNNLLEINDHGIGMNSEDLSHIGQPFFRAENTKHIHGYGVGLSLVMQIISIHNASVLIKSSPGVGTSFIINFPIKEF